MFHLNFKQGGECTKNSKRSKLYQTLLNAKSHDKTINQSATKKNTLYSVLANIKNKKVAAAVTRNAMPPTTLPTPGTRPTRPTRPTPPTRPTRPTDCPEMQPNNNGCGCGCPPGRKKETVGGNVSKSPKTLDVKNSKSSKTVGDHSATFKTLGSKQNTTSSKIEEKAKKRDFMSEILDNSLYNSPHHADGWKDFFDNGAQWDSYQSPQLHTGHRFKLDDPGYKVRLGFHDYDHATMEHANDLAHNHVEAYPGEIVSGENYLSKFVSPAVYGGVNSNRRHGYRRADYQSLPNIVDTHHQGFNRPLVNDYRNYHNYHGNGFHGEHAARDFPARRPSPSGYQRQMEGSRRDKFAGRDDEDYERESDNNRGGVDEERSSEYDRENNGEEQRYHGDKEDGNPAMNEERYHGDDEGRQEEGFHGNNGNNEEQGYNNAQDQKERGFSVGKENMKDVRVDSEERNVDIDSDHKNHFVDKQNYDEEARRNEEGGEREKHHEQQDEEQENRQGGEERESLNNRLNEGDGEQIQRQEPMVSKFIAGRQQGEEEDMTSREDDQQQQQNEGERNIQESQNRNNEGGEAEQTAAQAAARSEQQGGELEESALYENNNGGGEGGVEVGSRRSPEPSGLSQLLPPDQEISGRVKGMISAIETSDNIGGSAEEKKFIQHLMDVANHENDVLAHDLNLREQGGSSSSTSVEKQKDVSATVKSIDTSKNTHGNYSVVTSLSVTDVMRPQKAADSRTNENELSRVFAALSALKMTSLTPSAPENVVGDAKSLVGGKRQQQKSLTQDHKNETNDKDMENLKANLETFMKHLSGDRRFKVVTDRQHPRLNLKTISSIIKDVKQADNELFKQNNNSKKKSKINTNHQ